MEEVEAMLQDTSSGEAREVKKRVRTGCFNCRKKHKKCDEQKPICRACSLRMEPCEWPDASAAPKNKRRCTRRQSASRSDDSPDLNELQAIDTYSKNLESIDNSLATETTTATHTDTAWMNVLGPTGASPTNSYRSEGSHKESVSSEISPHNAQGQLTVTNGANGANGVHQQQQMPQTQQDQQNMTGNANLDFPFLLSPTDFNLLEYDDLKNTLRDYMFANASHLESTGSALRSPEPSANVSSPHDSESIGFLTLKEEKMLLKNYLYKVAPWLDMFDLSRQFGLETTQLSKNCKGLRYAMLALSARQKEKLDITYDHTKSKVLYQHALRHLIPSVKNAPDVGAISACVLLCVVEMMSVAPEKWRYHIEGCAALFKATGINGFSSKYQRALFWCFARMDVNSGVVGEQNTMIGSDKWLPNGVSVYHARDLFVKEDSIDMYANYMVFLCSRVLNLISSDNTSDFDKEWEILWKEVNQWHQDRPAQMKAIIEFDASPFPEVLYDNGPAISSNQLYHMAIILLYEVKPRGFKIDTKTCKPATWHAKQVCSISIHNDHHGCWNNSVQSLYVAGKLLTHKDEHRIVLDLLEKIEATTGWYMKFRANDLKEFWDQI